MRPPAVPPGAVVEHYSRTYTSLREVRAEMSRRHRFTLFPPYFINTFRNILHATSPARRLSRIRFAPPSPPRPGPDTDLPAGGGARVCGRFAPDAAVRPNGLGDVGEQLGIPTAPTQCVHIFISTRIPWRGLSDAFKTRPIG